MFFIGRLEGLMCDWPSLGGKHACLKQQQQQQVRPHKWEKRLLQRLVRWVNIPSKRLGEGESQSEWVSGVCRVFAGVLQSVLSVHEAPGRRRSVRRCDDPLCSLATACGTRLPWVCCVCGRRKLTDGDGTVYFTAPSVVPDAAYGSSHWCSPHYNPGASESRSAEDYRGFQPVSVRTSWCSHPLQPGLNAALTQEVDGLNGRMSTCCFWIVNQKPSELNAVKCC